MVARLYLLALLAACSGIAASQQKANPALPCYYALSDDPRFALIRERVSLGGSVAELHRMTESGDRVGQEERPVLEAWRSAREECHRIEVPYFAARDREIQALAREHFAAVQALIGELLAGAMTYGEFGRRRIELYEKVDSSIAEVRRRIRASKPPARNAEQK